VLAVDLGRDLRVPLFSLIQLAVELGRGDADDAALIALLMDLAARRELG
jgi:hypothetical protein